MVLGGFGWFRVLVTTILGHTNYSLQVENNVTVMKSSNCDNNFSLAFK